MQQEHKHDPLTDDREIEADIIVQLLHAHEQDHEHLSRTELERELAHIGPLVLNDAVARLQQRGSIHVDGEQITATNAEGLREKLDMLAAVVLHTLVTASPTTLPVEDIARDCERDPNDHDEREEIELALRRLVIDGLAKHHDNRWTATRPAIRAQDLSF